MLFAMYIEVTRNFYRHMTTDRLKLLTIKIKFAEELLQYSSQIVETDTASLEFSRKFLRFTPHTFVLTVMCPLPPQC